MPISSDSPADRHPRIEAGSVRLEAQSIHAKRPPAIIRRDLYVICSLLALAPIALCVRQRHWPAICGALARVVLVGRSQRRRTEAGIRLAFGGNDLAGYRSIEAVCRNLEAHELELRCQILRDLLPGAWRPEIRIDGACHLDAALDAGHGAILWVSRFAFADTIAKIGLGRLGHPPVHLSRAIHGFSHSRFGKRWLNPLQRHMENRYLAERVMVHEDMPGVAMRRLRDVLVGNGVVSISVHSWGSHAAELPLLDARIRIATGAPTLAWKTGARLMPVFAFREPRAETFHLLIDKPLPIDGAQSKIEAQKCAAVRYAERLEHHVLAHPGQWLDWSTVRPVAV
jgi:lauroyl/myristoyl acyltransferase